MYPWQNLLLCFGSSSCMSTNPWPICRVLDEIAWSCSMLLQPVWFNLSFTWCKSPTLQSATPHHNRALSMLCGWCVQVVAAFSPTHHLTYLLLFDPNISNFYSQVQKTLFHRSLNQSLCVLAQWNLLTLFYFSTVVSWQ